MTAGGLPRVAHAVLSSERPRVVLRPSAAADPLYAANENPVADSTKERAPRVCKWGVKCVRRFCKYDHPDGRAGPARRGEKRGAGGTAGSRAARFVVDAIDPATTGAAAAMSTRRYYTAVPREEASSDRVGSREAGPPHTHIKQIKLTNI